MIRNLLLKSPLLFACAGHLIVVMSGYVYFNELARKIVNDELPTAMCSRVRMIWVRVDS